MLTKDQISLIHVEVARLKLTDEDYRAILMWPVPPVRRSWISSASMT
jgi:hypothetical protein